jgi:hypothetical protein
MGELFSVLVVLGIIGFFIGGYFGFEQWLYEDELNLETLFPWTHVPVPWLLLGPIGGATVPILLVVLIVWASVKFRSCA